MNNKRVIVIVSVIVIIIAAACLFIIPKVIQSNRYDQAVSYAEHGIYDEAIELFAQLKNYKDSDAYMDYCLMRKAVANGEYETGGQYAAKIPEFKDAASYQMLCECHALAESGDLESAMEKAGNIELSESKTLFKKWQDEYTVKQTALIEEAISQENWDRAKEIAEHSLNYSDDPQLTKLREESILRIHARDYDQSIALIQEGNFDDALPLLETLDGYNESGQLLSHLSQGEQGKAYVYAMFSEETDPHVLVSLYKAAGDYADAAERSKDYQDRANEQDYELAQKCLDNSEWQKAKQLFSSLGDYKDSRVLEKVCDNGLRQEAYIEAKTLMENGDFEAAEQAFIALGSYMDSKVLAVSCHDAVNEQQYLYAMQLIDAQSYEEAYTILTNLGDYRDSKLICRWLEMEEK